jgi:hypothetical protein
VTANGLSSSIMTFYEITDGDLSDSTGQSFPIPHIPPSWLESG